MVAGRRIAAPGNQRAAKHTGEGHAGVRDGDLHSTHFNLHYWEDWCYQGRVQSVPEGAGSRLKAQRMENVCCCFCLTLGTDPAEIITEGFTLPCQICRYFAALRLDALFL